MLPVNIPSTFLYGKNVEFHLFKSMFHFAEEGGNVWFISQEPIKQLPQGIDPPEKESLKLITFLYIKDYKELLKHLNGIHIWHKVPELIILNGFTSYIWVNSSTYSPITAAFLCASLKDAASACARKLSKAVYLLVASDDLHSNAWKLQTIIDLYFQQCVAVSTELNYLELNNL